MVIYIDDGDGNRVQATPRYLDTPLGVRRNLSGVIRIDRATNPPPPPPPPPPTPTTTPQLMFYPSSRITDAGVRAAFSQDPQGYSSYWQPSNYQSLVTVEGARMGRGCHIVNLLASVKDWSGNANQSRDTVVNTLAGNPPAILTDYLTLSEQVASQHPNLFYSVCPMGEVEVGVNQQVSGAITSMTSLFNHYGGDLTAIFTALGQFMSAFFDLADELAPSCLRSFWMGGSTSGQNVAHRNTFYSQITNPPSYIPSDPYNNAHTGETPLQTWTPDVNMYRATSGVHHSHWLRWGQPPIALNETGSSHMKPSTGAVVNTDAEVAAWIRQMYEAADALDLHHVIYFNSAGGQGTQFITGGSFDEAVAAYAGEIVQAKAAAAAA